MVAVIWAPDEIPPERHLVLRAHRDKISGVQKGYFYPSDEDDWGGSGPFDMLLDEVMERAKLRAADLGLSKIIVVRTS
ncbi:hypothetical protein [Bosea sp. MMO-172]|uniref:hypothetical protein n=1 Tax=Bosea sp. MMO-172 TaxID=3127885 RepID=UPI003018EA73